MSAHPNPLVVDLDGTLVKSDLLIESILLLLKKNLLFIFLLPIWLLSGKAHFKYQIASRVQIDASLLPYNVGLIDYLAEQHEEGRPVVLATASSELLANPVAKHLAIFSNVIASTEDTNFKGDAKANQLNKAYGSGHYDYAGNSNADLAVWSHARAAILVGVPTGLRRKVENTVSI